MRVILVAALMVAMTLAGCSDGDPKAPDFDDVDVEVSETTGAIIGYVVDQTITPIAEARIVLDADTEGEKETTTDAEGRFVFSNIDAGVHFVTARKAGYEEAQTSVDVVAGLKSPPKTKIQLDRLFDQEPFSEAFKMSGFLACGYSAVLITAPCVTDYTSILPVCPGGCANQLREVQGDVRDYTMAIGAGWQQMVIEMEWEPSATGTSSHMGPTVSYSQRTATHWFAQGGSESPMRLQIDSGEVHGSNQQSSDSPYDPNMIPPEGIEDLMVFMNIRRGPDDYHALAVNQEFELFHHTFYFGVPELEDWSFIRGDPVPF